MGIVRIHEDILNDKPIMEALKGFFKSMEEVDHDKYRKTKEFRVTGDGVPDEDVLCTVKVYYPDGVRPFVIEIE